MASLRFRLRKSEAVANRPFARLIEHSGRDLGNRTDQHAYFAVSDLIDAGREPGNRIGQTNSSLCFDLINAGCYLARKSPESLESLESLESSESLESFREFSEL